MRTSGKGISMNPEGTINGPKPHTKGTPPVRGQKSGGKIPSGKSKGKNK